MPTQLNIFSPKQLFRDRGGEALLQYIWQFQYFNKAELLSATGERLCIVHPGSPNANQGPDFLNARIKIGNTTFVGSVEVHISTSDWLRHAHEEDAQYSNVILHVVFSNDAKVNDVPVLELQPRIAVTLLEHYQRLMEAKHCFLPCGSMAARVKPVIWTSWKERLLVERLSRKTAMVTAWLQQSGQHWEQVFWWMLARTFGTPLNADNFESIARSIPLQVLARHKTQLIQLEAILLGQAGLLDGVFEDDYPKLLQREYQFLKKKWRLQPAGAQLAFLRMRPGNFPTIRLAQLAALVHKSSHLFSKVIEAKNLKDVVSLLEVGANDYWHYHYLPDRPSLFKPKRVGATMMDNIIINAVVPVLFAYGLDSKKQDLKDKALIWLQQLKPEANNIINGFGKLGIAAISAYDSQALLQLKNEYCSKKKCLCCAIGNALLKQVHHTSHQDHLSQSSTTSISG